MDLVACILKPKDGGGGVKGHEDLMLSALYYIFTLNAKSTH